MQAEGLSYLLLWYAPISVVFRVDTLHSTQNANLDVTISQDHQKGNSRCSV